MIYKPTSLGIATTKPLNIHTVYTISIYLYNEIILKSCTTKNNYQSSLYLLKNNLEDMHIL